MTIKLFPNFKREELTEENNDKTYESYTAIVIDPIHNEFKIIKGDYLDKKDMYKKLSKRGLVVRKSFETKVWNWMEENAPSNLIAYMMFSTAFSKWKNNNMLGKYYDKLLHDIPQLNREKEKGDPNSKGGKLISLNKQESVDDEFSEDLLTETEASDRILYNMIDYNDGKVPSNNEELEDLISSYYDSYPSEDDNAFNAASSDLEKLMNARSDDIKYGFDKLDKFNSEGKLRTYYLKIYNLDSREDSIKGKTPIYYTCTLRNGSDTLSDDPALNILLYDMTIQDTGDVEYLKMYEESPYVGIEVFKDKGYSEKINFNEDELTVYSSSDVKSNILNKNKKREDGGFYDFVNPSAKKEREGRYNASKDAYKNGDDLTKQLSSKLMKINSNVGQILRGDDKEEYDVVNSFVNKLGDKADVFSENIVEVPVGYLEGILYKYNLYDGNKANFDNFKTKVSSLKKNLDSMKEKYGDDLLKGYKKENSDLVNAKKYDELFEKFYKEMYKNSFSISPSKKGFVVTDKDLDGVRKSLSFVRDLLSSKANEISKKMDSNLDRITRYAEMPTRANNQTVVNNYNPKLSSGSRDEGDFDSANKARDRALNKLRHSKFDGKDIATGLIALDSPKPGDKEYVSKANMNDIDWNGFDDLSSFEMNDEDIDKDFSESYVNDGANTLINGGVIDTEAMYNTPGTVIPMRGTLEEDNTHGELNQNLFDGIELKKDVEEALLDVAYKFMNDLDLPFHPVDIYFTGSCANYNYNDASDIDLHLVYDFENAGVNADILNNYLFAAKNNFNTKYDIKIKGIPVEVGCENVNEPLVSTGVYSLLNDVWVNSPSYKNVEYVGVDTPYFDEIKDKIERAVQSGSSQEMKNIVDFLGKLRRDSLAKDGEFGLGNLLFKKLRADGIIGKLKQAYYNSESKELSLESLGEM